MALTAAEIADYRLLIGDVETDHYILTDTQIQTLYDAAETDAPDSSLIDEYAVVYMLRRMVGATSRYITHSDGLGTTNSANLRYDHLKEMLEEAENRAGIGGAMLTVGGSIDWNMDENPAS